MEAQLSSKVPLMLVNVLNVKLATTASRMVINNTLVQRVTTAQGHNHQFSVHCTPTIIKWVLSLQMSAWVVQLDTSVTILLLETIIIILVHQATTVKIFQLKLLSNVLLELITG